MMSLTNWRLTHQWPILTDTLHRTDALIVRAPIFIRRNVTGPNNQNSTISHSCPTSGPSDVLPAESKRCILVVQRGRPAALSAGLCRCSGKPACVVAVPACVMAVSRGYPQRPPAQPSAPVFAVAAKTSLAVAVLARSADTPADNARTQLDAAAQPIIQ